MGKDERRGARRDRNKRSFKRIPELGYYFVVTDARETEVNYLHGFRDSIPPELRNRLVIKVITASTFDLLTRCLEMAAIEPQYRKPWVVFDRDQLRDFDNIIADAKRQSVNVGWSNPCLEIWFHAYFSDMPVNNTPAKCIDALSAVFKKHAEQEYSKTDVNIYTKLCRYGDEKAAIDTANRRYKLYDCDKKPSEMLSATTLYQLINEVRNKCPTLLEALRSYGGFLCRECGAFA